ncbi:hypothetical protein [Halorussus marinus]|uniref:hypothetical protein n=1 Tax=Halorussus marinus TaxID=2505976 RepID=UPI00106E0FF7|nr:hypothetical protein [Halorussus marinus]
MRYALLVCVVLVSLSGCAGVLDESPESTTARVTTQDSVEQTSTVSTPTTLSPTTDLVELNVESVALSGNYTLTKSPNQSNTELSDVSNIRKSQKNIFAREGDAGTQTPIAVQSTLVLVDQTADSASVAAEILDLYTDAEGVEFTSGDIRSFEYTTPSGYDATISIAVYQNAIIYATEVGGNGHYTQVTEDVTERVLRHAERRAP